ncbi:MAG: hypothetical protein IAF94_00730 [Pirellulaceae bacterium]|nr:hypothetical protein [Pirellulaceae bacterium]
MATSPDPKERDGAQAVRLAEQAVKLNPNEGLYWNTLGAARYRAGDWQGAIVALSKSQELQRANEGFDWFFLAMAHWQLGEKEQAQKWYDRAVEWVSKFEQQNEEVLRFRAEAAELLGIKDEPKQQKELPPKSDEG